MDFIGFVGGRVRMKPCEKGYGMNRLRIVVALILTSLFVVYVAHANPIHPADSCMEDEAWVPVNYKLDIGREDAHGVTRACVNIDEYEWSR